MDLPLDDNRGRLTYWLFYAGRYVTYAYAEALRAHCEERRKSYIVTPPQWGALSLLLVQDGMTIGTMSQKRGVDAPAATGIITRLEQSGLVERRHDCEDRRVVKVYLTDEGRDISHTLVSTVEHFEQSLKQGFSDVELDRFLAHLHQLITNAAELGGEASDRFGLLTKDMMERNEGTKK
ncbi:MAG TPA: MarR family transcriptional regulator [Ktedonobacteraceae bacterium]|nr:MarR family transcriptional regulator [Ktedonobacteraceae bacterium]